jgi:hypothetical protein
MSPPTGRRAALRGLAATAAAALATASVRPVEAMGAAHGPHHDDAAVFAACAAVQRAQEALLAIDEAMSTIDWSTPAWAAAKRVHDSAWKAREAAYDELCGLRPLTLAGHAARASAAVLAGAGCRGDGPQTVVELLDAELVLTVLDSLAALPAAATSAAGAIGVASSSPAAVLRDLAPQAVPHRPPARQGHADGGAPGSTPTRSA